MVGHETRAFAAAFKTEWTSTRHYNSSRRATCAVYHLSPLTREELPAYLAHRLRRAGTELNLFDPPAQEALFQASGGLPRKINLLAHHALLAAAIARAKTVSAELVELALPEVA